MKLKNALQFFGLFRGRTKRYGYRVVSCDLGEEGTIDYAIWQHPSVQDYTVERTHIDAYREFIKEGDFCIDIGAHGGDSTLPMALAAGSSGAVLALEPNHYVFPVLEKNSRLNHGKYHIIPLMAAAGQSEGEMIFEYSDAGYCNGGRHEGMSFWIHGHPFKLSTYGINLSQELRDDFSRWLPKLKYIKVDAEGYDLYILRSLSNIIEIYRPYIKAEVFKRTSLEYRRQLFSFFDKRGYRIFEVAEEPCIRGETISAENLQRRLHYDIMAIPMQ